MKVIIETDEELTIHIENYVKNELNDKIMYHISQISNQNDTSIKIGDRVNKYLCKVKDNGLQLYLAADLEAQIIKLV